jgi:hypothetical protein
MSLYCRVIQAADLEEIYQFEQVKLSLTVPDENERTFQSWKARWRKEALEHYLSLGWSFLARDPDIESPLSNEGQLVGYFLAQPFLFMEAQTQCLWVEHMAHSSLQARDELCDLAYRLSREKHFQRVLFPNIAGISNSVGMMKPEVWQPGVLAVKTTKQ